MKLLLFLFGALTGVILAQGLIQSQYDYYIDLRFPDKVLIKEVRLYGKESEVPADSLVTWIDKDNL